MRCDRGDVRLGRGSHREPRPHRDADHGRPWHARQRELLRPRPQGLRRHGSQHRLQGVVHRRRRRAVGHLLADRRRDQRPHPPVPGHRRAQLHRPPDAGHDLQGPPRLHRHELHGPRHTDRRRPPLQHHDHLHRRPGARCRADARALRRAPRRPAVRAARSAGRRHRWRRLPERRRQLARCSTDPAACRSPSTRTRSPTPSTATTRSRPTWRSSPRAASRARASATPTAPATA